MTTQAKYDPYQGDVKKILTARGATVQFRGGQPLMDQGVENAAMYSLFSRSWFANVFFQNPDQKLESKFEEEHEKPITLKQLLNIEDAAQKALAWMLSQNIASKIDVETTAGETGKIKTAIQIKPPEGDLTELLITKHGQNWLAQAAYPANEKVVR